jgi:hypothetical protein
MLVIMLSPIALALLSSTALPLLLSQPVFNRAIMPIAKTEIRKSFMMQKYQTTGTISKQLI